MDESDDSDVGADEMTNRRRETPTEHSPNQNRTGGRDSGSQIGEDVTDPVKSAHSGTEDLYDIATWEARSSLDRFAIRLTQALRTTRTLGLVGVAFLLFLTQAVFAGLLIFEEPLLGLLGLLSMLPALILVLYIWYGDPTRREPFELLAVTFLLSMLFASFAAVTNDALFPVFELIPIIGLPLVFFLVVGPIEETVKWLAIRVYAYKSDSFRTVVDGAVYGAVAGLGFAAIENVIYILVAYLEAAPEGTAVQEQYAIGTAVARSFVGPGHVVFSAWAGFYLGLAKFNPENRGPIVVKGILIAAFIHGVYNTTVTFVPLGLFSFIAFIIIFHGFWFGLLYRKIAAYRQLYRQTNSQRNLL